MRKLTAVLICLLLTVTVSQTADAAVAAPTVTAVAPTSGSAAGGTVVTVTGTNLLGATKATFGGTAGTAVTVVSATQLKVTSPAHATGVVDIQVTTGGGTSVVATADKYTLVDVTPPAPVTAVSAAAATTTVRLSWTNPTDPDFAGVLIRRSAGPMPPTSPSAGSLVTDTAASGVSFTDNGLSPSTQYSYALFAHDGVPNYASAATKTVTTSADVTPPAVPAGVTVEVRDSAVKLSWNPNTETDLAGYEVF